MQIEELYNYILENNLLSSAEISYVQVCLNDITELSPADKPMVFRKMEKLIQDSDNLAWCIFSVNQQLILLNKAYRKIKDPEFTILVRQGRPSTEAINSEIRMKHDELYDLEEQIAIVEQIVEYFRHIELSLERYIYMLKDKLKNQ